MASKDVNYEFSQFGSKMKKLGILSILGFIFGLLSNLFLVLGIINIIIIIISLAVLFSALGNAKEAGYILNNRLLHEFRSKIIKAFILYLIGLILFFGAMMAIIRARRPGIGIFFIVIGVIILIIAAILRIQGWGRLLRFFEENMSMFPTNIGVDAQSGAKFLKYAGILFLTVILAFIGFILEIVGYFKLSSLTKLSGSTAVQPTPQPVAQPTQTTTAPATPPKKFCPNCGSPITGTERYCAACGSEL
ncbi:MAG: zinc ribbon domain-containing protein [Promethearchaeota archaeon]|nr:MAG: zinc ribbon domain-containing protein [Candidatus Lokiarchaeota archaeon]